MAASPAIIRLTAPNAAPIAIDVVLLDLLVPLLPVSGSIVDEGRMSVVVCGVGFEGDLVVVIRGGPGSVCVIGKSGEGGENVVEKVLSEESKISKRAGAGPLSPYPG